MPRSLLLRLGVEADRRLTGLNAIWDYFRLDGNPLAINLKSTNQRHMERQTSFNDRIEIQGVAMIPFRPLRQVKYPDSRARTIFVFNVIVSLHQDAALRAEFVVHSKPAVIAGTTCYDSRGYAPFTRQFSIPQ